METWVPIADLRTSSARLANPWHLGSYLPLAISPQPRDQAVNPIWRRQTWQLAWNVVLPNPGPHEVPVRAGDDDVAALPD